MDLGPYNTYRLPYPIRQAYGVTTAKELTKQLNLQGELSLEAIREAENAYAQYAAGDLTAAFEFLTKRGGMTTEAATEALRKLY